MNLTPDDAHRRFAATRVAHLATSANGQPHLIPVTFAVTDDEIFSAVDHKPKCTVDLRRLRNIRINARVSLLADHYADDWLQLWWVRADGIARIVTDGEEREAALNLLATKYPQYRENRPAGPLIITSVRRWTGWAYAER